MKTPFARLFSSTGFGDFLNPLLVRELRQSLRSRIFAGAIILSSLVCAIVIICGILWVSTSGKNNANAGRHVFFTLYFILWGLCCVIMPLIAASRFRKERGSGEFELFLITGISARRIVAGKLQAALTQALLILSVAAPFMMVCYLLRGISAVNIAVNILVLVICGIVFTQGGILLGSLTTSKVLFGLLNLPFLWLLAMSFTIAGAQVSNDLFSMFLDTGGIFVAVLLILASILYVLILLHLCAVAMLELRVRNRSMPIRLYLLVCTLFIPLLFIVLPDSPGDLGFIYSMFIIPFAISAAFVPLPKQIPSTPIRRKWRLGWRRYFCFLFYPTRGSMLIWYTCFICIISFWEYFLSDGIFKPFTAVLCGAILIWSILGNIAFRPLLPRASVFMLSIIGCAIPSLLAVFLLFADQATLGMLICPFSITAVIEDFSAWDSAGIFALIVWAVLLVSGIGLYVGDISHEPPIPSFSGEPMSAKREEGSGL